MLLNLKIERNDALPVEDLETQRFTQLSRGLDKYTSSGCLSSFVLDFQGWHLLRVWPLLATHFGANDSATAKRPERVQDAGKGDCPGRDCAFFLSTPAEISVIARPTGKGSMKVIAALKNGFSYSSLSFSCC